MPQATVSFTAAQGARILVNLGKTLSLVDANNVPRDATAAEYNDWLRDVTVRMVQGQELKDAQQALAAPQNLSLT